MADIRRFTKTDWYSWAGAEKFSSGTDPWIYEQELEDQTTVTAIADATGIQIIMCCDDEEADMAVWYKEIHPFGPLRARAELYAMSVTLQNYTSAATLCYDLTHENAEAFKGLRSLY